MFHISHMKQYKILTSIYIYYTHNEFIINIKEIYRKIYVRLY